MGEWQTSGLGGGARAHALVLLHRANEAPITPSRFGTEGGVGWGRPAFFNSPAAAPSLPAHPHSCPHPPPPERDPDFTPKVLEEVRKNTKLVLVCAIGG